MNCSASAMLWTKSSWRMVVIGLLFCSSGLALLHPTYDAIAAS
jgi:hypothetical protein